MESPAEVIHALNATQSRLEKEDILQLVMEEPTTTTNDTFIKLAMRALDTYRTFGVKQVPVATQVDTVTVSNFSDDFTSMLARLEERTLSGNAARDLIETFALNCDATLWNSFYRLILLKDLKCGVSVTTWNKVAKRIDPRFVVPVFDCQLAHDGANHEKKITGKKLIEVKLDGVRVITVVKTNGDVQMFSRNGKPLNNFPKIAEWFSTKVAPHLQEAMVFDGEVMSSSFQDLMKQVHRKDNVETDDAVLYLFDTLTLDEFMSGKSLIPQEVRSQELANISDTFNASMIRTVAYDIVDLDTDAGKQRMSEINKEAIELGYEGIMIKDPLAPYQCKRSHAWLKIKPYIEVTLTITDIQEGTGKYETTTGALVCNGRDAGQDIVVNVGSGLSDSLRDSIWANRQLVIGQLVEVKADAITKNQDGTYSLRFPRFKCFRGFEIGEKL